jgi:glutamyl-tRNA reductase
MDIFCFGLSHHATGVALRERFAVESAELAGVLGQICRHARLDEAVLLSTCNRVEIYARSAAPADSLKLCADFFRIRGGDGADFYQWLGPACARHLFRVACGLDSMVVGETEILGQVKSAYATALDGNLTGAVLNRLFQQAFRSAKKVRSQTGITRGSVSVGSVAVELAEKVFGDLADCRVLLLGAGKAGARVARSLQSQGVRQLILANRTFERAVRLAEELGGMALPFDRWANALPDVDMVISSTGSHGYLLTAGELQPVAACRCDMPLLFVDLAVPRDFDPLINNLEGVYLHDLDSLQAIARQGLAEREKEVEHSESIINDHVTVFDEWLGQRQPTSVTEVSRS